MIKVKKDFSIIPEGLLMLKDATDWIQKALDEGKEHEPRSHVYGHDTVRKSLKKIYIKKCGYCESRLEVSGYMRIEHYRPKGRVKENEKHPGYYWLTYEWSNLISSCEICNSRKGTSFPVENDHIYQPHGNRKEWRADSTLMQSEKPLLLHPEIDDPDEHLTINENGEIKPKNGSQRGETSIKLCDLNRDGLIQKRAKIIVKFRKDLLNIALLIKDDVENKQIITKEDFLNTISKSFKQQFDELKESKYPKEEFSLVGKSMWRDFKAFFAKDEDKAMSDILLKAYDLLSDEMERGKA